MRKLFVLFGVFIFLFSQSVVARVTPFDTNTELLITHFERALKLIIADDYFLGEDEWKLRNIYTNILKEIGREDDVVKRYRGFARMTDLKMFRSDLRDQLREYLENKPNKTLFMRRLTKLLLEQDPYAQFFSEEDFKKSLKGKPYSDDGLIFGAQDHELIVVAIYPESSAEKAGMRSRDVIVKINDASVVKKDDENDEELEERAWSFIVAHKELVKYSVLRGGVPLDFYTEFKKKDIEEKTQVNAKEISGVVDGDIGVITMKTFYSHTIKDRFLAIYKDFVEDKKIKGIIIDLRDNTGGYLFEAVAVASFFITDEHVLVINKKDKRQFVKTLILPGVSKFKGPVVVMVNSLTASASEMLAASLRQHGQLIVGSKTLGKNIAQVLRVLSDGSVVLISNFSTAIPDGPNRMIPWAQGIAPDYEVYFSEGKVNAMTIAKEKLRELFLRP